MKRTVIAITTAAALAASGAAVAGAAGGDDDATEEAITGTALDRAGRAALDHVGGGKVSATEVGDEEGYYEVEVTKPDGTQVDVHLNRDFSPAGTKSDGD